MNNERTTDDYILDRFMNVKWSEQERDEVLGLPLYDLPYLPLDIKIPDDDLASIVEKIESIDESNFFFYCQATIMPYNSEKLVFYGPDNYKDFWIQTRDALSHEHFRELSDVDNYKWQIEIPEIEDFVSTIPMNELYMVECRNSKIDGKAYVHRDREKVYKGLNNRIFVPLTWDDGNRFAVTGLGDIHAEPGRPFVLNGNSWHHGTVNTSGKRRLAIIISANTHGCTEFDELLKRSYKKFANVM